MTTELTSPAARYVTLRDYLHVLRRYRIMIVLIAIIGAGAGLADVLRQKPVYTATAEVSFQDPTQDLNLVGIGSTAVQNPAQLASVNAETATGPAVMGQVKRRLKTPLTVSALTAAISSTVAVPSGLLDIKANAASPSFAAQLGNSVAGVLIDQDNAQTRAEFTQIANSIRRRISQLRGASASPVQLAFYEDELARLDTLAAFAQSAQLAKVAQPPAGPSSPHRLRGVILGLVLGLLLGIVAAFVRDAMDRRLRSPRDIESSFQLPVVGHVRNQSMGRVAQISNGNGEHDALELESFRILRRNLEFLDRENPPRSILITSALPQEGKTTVASSLAVTMASAGKSTLLVDCDMRRPALAERLGVERTPGMSEYLAGAASPRDILRTVEFSEPPLISGTTEGSTNGHGAASLHPKLVCIPSGSATSHAAELLGSSRFKEFVEQVRQTYEVVIFDSSPLLPVADTLEMLPHVDAIVICARESQTTRDQAHAAKAALERFPERPMGVVVTGIKPRGTEYEVYAYSYGDS